MYLCMKDYNIDVFIYTTPTDFDIVFSRFIFCSAFTAEQYQQHQQQLALMQKQQLAQIHQQQANSNSSANTSQVRDLSVL